MSKGQWGKTTRLVDAMTQVLSEESPMTVRQLFYRLVSRGDIENTRKHYVDVSRALTKARNNREIPWGWIVDRSRPVYQATTWSDLRERFEYVATTYRRDAWQDQPHYVEIWSEKDAVVGSVEEITDKYAVPLRVTRGFSSTTTAHEIANVFRRISKPISVFYIGDHDPSGREIEKDAYRRVKYYGADFGGKRLAIHSADIRKFNLPPLRIKSTDTNAAEFQKRYGLNCVELDALPPAELRRRIEEAILSKLDMHKWKKAEEIEELERETTERIARSFEAWRARKPESLN